jgi:hypothetical protein
MFIVLASPCPMQLPTQPKAARVAFSIVKAISIRLHSTIAFGTICSRHLCFVIASSCDPSNHCLPDTLSASNGQPAYVTQQAVAQVRKVRLAEHYHHLQRAAMPNHFPAFDSSLSIFRDGDVPNMLALLNKGASPLSCRCPRHSACIPPPSPPLTSFMRLQRLSALWFSQYCSSHGGSIRPRCRHDGPSLRLISYHF